MAGRLRQLVAACRRLTRATRATAAVEFAIILPVALLLYAGACEVGDGVIASRRATTVARTLVDLVSQQQTSSQVTSTPTPANAVTAATLSSLLTSAKMLLFPEPTNTLSMTLSAIDVVNTPLGTCCTARVRWSYTQGGTLRPCDVTLIGVLEQVEGTLNTLPQDLLPVGTILPQPLSYIIADVGYTYQPALQASLLNFAPTFKRTLYMLPRSVGQVVTEPLPASGPQYGKVCY